MTTLEILKAARERISDRARWCTGVAAVDVDGRPVGPNSSTSCRWCAYGAVWSLSDSFTSELSLETALEQACKALHGDEEDIVSINDGPDGHARVLAIYDHAIARLEQEQEAAQ